MIPFESDTVPDLNWHVGVHRGGRADSIAPPAQAEHLADAVAPRGRL